MNHPESQEQQALFSWAEYAKGLHPELGLLYHIPNGGKRDKLEAARLKLEGVKAGVPDLCLPVARGGAQGRQKQGDPAPAEMDHRSGTGGIRGGGLYRLGTGGGHPD